METTAPAQPAKPAYRKLAPKRYAVVGTDVVVAYTWITACGYLWVAKENDVRVGTGATRNEAASEALAKLAQPEKFAVIEIEEA